MTGTRVTENTEVRLNARCEAIHKLGQDFPALMFYVQQGQTENA